MPNFDDAQSRRLLVYLLLDRSSSMDGEPIAAVNEGVRVLHQELCKNPHALETVSIAFIAFASGVERSSLVPLADFEPPTLTASGNTYLGEALHELNDAIDADFRPRSEESGGDYKPLVFLLTDGQPTDSWQMQAKVLRQRTVGRVAHIVALGCGPDVDTQMLKDIGDTALHMSEVDPELLHSFFKWVSASVGTASIRPGDLGNGGFLAEPPSELHVL